MSAPETPPVERGLTLRALLVALVFAAISTWWMKLDEIVSHTIQLGESVPPVPAVAALVLFLLLNPLLARIHPKLALRRPEMVVVFVFMSVAPVLNSVGMMRMMLPALTVPQYFATPENRLGEVWPLVPKWWGPKGEEIIRQMYEGAPNERVPWDVWWPSLCLWALFALAFFVTMLCLNILMRKQWTERERLAFPLVQFVAPLVPDSSKRIAAIIRNPLLWVGFGLAFLYNALNMLKAVNPSVPAPGVNFNLGALFTERPWSAIQPLTIAWRPDLFGLGYLMSTEITFSIWFFYLLVRFSNVLGTAAGVSDQYPGFPFDRELCMGSYLALTLFILWIARRHLWSAARRALGRGDRSLDEGEPTSYRWAFFGFIGGLGFMIAWAVASGMALWLAVLYFALIIGVALTYTRIRAETGAPMVWLFPFWEHQNFIVNVFGTKGLVPGAGGEAAPPIENFRSATVLHGFAWLSRGYYTTTSAAQIEAFRLADELRTRRRDMVYTLLLACVVGIAMAYWAHLTAYYKYGGNVLEGGSTEGGYRIRLMTQSYTTVAGWIQTPASPVKPRIWATGVGFSFTLILVVLRAMFLRFPLHPLGFAMTLAHGAIWGPALLVWILKTAILRVGGVRLYKALIPLFIGIVLGHFFTAGIGWGMVALFNEELAEKYGVWFG